MTRGALSFGVTHILSSVLFVLVVLSSMTGSAKAREGHTGEVGARVMGAGSVQVAGEADYLDTTSFANVKISGAQGNWIHDDTDAISAALENLPTGGTLYFPPGVYRISREIEVRSNVEIACNSATIEAGSLSAATSILPRPAI